MQARTSRWNPYGWLSAHVVELAFALLAIGFVGYVLRISEEFSFWSDDLALIERASSGSQLFDSYNGHLSVTILLIYRAVAEVSGLSYTPFMIAGAVSLAAVPVSYFLTTRRQFGPPLAAILSIPLLWYDGVNFRPAGLNHNLALIGGIICAAALNRGRRADWWLAAALAFSLCSAGGGVVVAAACVVHSALTRPPWRRWIAILAPSALYGIWWVLAEAGTTSPTSLSVSQSARVVRDLFLQPFYQIAFGVKPIGVLLVVAFFAWGFVQLRRGLVAGANFVAWTAAMIGWALALVQSRGIFATATTFRYAYVSLGFALLAVVPRQPIRWPERLSTANRLWLPIAASLVIVCGVGYALHARPSMRAFAEQHNELGRKAKGAMLALQLGPDVIPDSTPVRFFRSGNPHGTAGETRALMARYGSPVDVSTSTIDQELVDEGIAQSRLGPVIERGDCRRLTEPIAVPPTSYREAELGVSANPIADAFPGPLAHQLWSPTPFVVDVRRYGNRWARLAEVPASRDVFLTLPVLNTDKPWEIRATGACVIEYPIPP